MDSNTLIKCAKCCARKSSTKKRLIRKRANYVKQAALEKYAAAIKAVYNFKLAGMDLLEQANRDPDLAATLQNQFK